MSFEEARKEILDDLKEGLQTLGVLEAMQTNPEQFRDVLTKKNICLLEAETSRRSWLPKGVDVKELAPKSLPWHPTVLQGYLYPFDWLDFYALWIRCQLLQ